MKNCKNLVFKALMYLFGLFGASVIAVSLLSIYTTRAGDGIGRWVASLVLGFILAVISVIGLSMED